MKSTQPDWTQEEKDLLRSVWNSSQKLAALVDQFPGRTVDQIYRQGLRTLKLGSRRVPQDFDRMLNWKRIVANLELGPKTAKQIAIATGMRVDKVLVLLKRRKGRLVYVFAWTEPNGSMPQMIWALGDAESAPRPQKMDKAEIARRYTAKLKKESPEKLEEWRSRRKVREKLNTGEWIRRDPAAAWF